MPDFITPLEDAALRKKHELSAFFSPNQSEEEASLFRSFCGGGHWHPLPEKAGHKSEAFAVDGGLKRLELSNGGTMFVAQSLLIGESVEYTAVDVEILRGSVPAKTVDRFGDLFRQRLEVKLAADHIEDLERGGVMLMDGALYGGLPHLYPMPEQSGIRENLPVILIKDYQRLFAVCDCERLLVSVAKSSRDSMLVDTLQDAAGIREEDHVFLPDSEMIYRWTGQRAGFSTPVLLGTRSFLGGSATILLEPEHPVSRMPAILSFFVRLADYTPAMRVDVPGVCVGLNRQIGELKSDLSDYRQVEPIVAELLADYGGLRVYNPLLFSADKFVAIHSDKFQDIYLPILETALGVHLEPTLSESRFLEQS